MKNTGTVDAQRLQSILDYSPDIICMIDAEEKFIQVSAASLKILGYEPAEMEGRRFTDFVCAEDASKTGDAFEKAKQETWLHHFENRCIKKDGRPLSLYWSARYEAESKIMYCVARDATAINKTNEELIQSNERFYHVAQATHDAIWDLDLAANKLTWGFGYGELFGHDTSDPATNNESRHARIHPDDYEDVIYSLHHALKTGTTWRRDYRYKRMNGTYAFVSDKAVILRNAANKPYRMIGALHDATKRREAEMALALSEQRFRSLVQNGSDLIAIINGLGDYSYVSPTSQSVLGYPPAFFIGKNAFHFIHPDDVEATLAGMKKMETDAIVHLAPFRFQHANGEWRWIETILNNMSNDPAVNGIVANSRDITEKKKIAEQLEREHKERHRRIAKEVVMAQEKERAEIGTELHDNVNQILVTIKLYLDMVKSGDKDKAVFLDKSILFLNNTIEEIRKLSKKLCAYTDDFNLGASIAELADSLQCTQAPAVHLNINGLKEDKLDVHHKLAIYRIVQEQLTNIIKHAQATEVLVSISETGNELLLSICDNGIGFNCKQKKKGIGLKNIANRAGIHFGKVEMTSAQNQGCNLKVRFDLARHKIYESM